MDLRHPHFAEPGWLWLAVLASAGLMLLHRYTAWARKKQIARFAAPELLANLLSSHSPARRIIKNVLLVLGIAGLSFAMARPQWGETTEISQALGEDILFVVDCSKSMLATDVKPNRLGRARFAILDFVQKHGRGRVGLVAFAGEAFIQCPLTFDYDAFREALNAMDDKTIPVPGTDIGRALDEGSRAMEKNDRRKVLILVTDGEDLEKKGITKARELADNNIVVYSIGVGTTAGSPIQFVNDRGVTETMRDANGRVVLSQLDEVTLSEIAAATHGSYHPLGNLGEGLSDVRKLVENSTSEKDFSRMRKLGVDRYYFPIALATMLLVLESLIGTRRRQTA
jgi:Ca-activated chloride channel family protein